MSSRVYYDSSFEQNEVSKNITGRKKVSRYYKMALFSQSWQKGDKNDHRAKMETNEHESKQMKNTPIYKQPRNVWDDVLVSNETKCTYFNPPLPCPFQRVVSRTAKMELFFSDSQGDPGLFVRLFLYVADSFFLFQRVFFSECRNSLFRDRRTRFELRDVERRFEGS